MARAAPGQTATQTRLRRSIRIDRAARETEGIRARPEQLQFRTQRRGSRLSVPGLLRRSGAVSKTGWIYEHARRHTRPDAAGELRGARRCLARPEVGDGIPYT